MPWARFTADFDFRPHEHPRVQLAYKAGRVYLVTARCLAEARAAGKAVEAKRPKHAARS